jgi:hypothetical protein
MQYVWELNQDMGQRREHFLPEISACIQYGRSQLKEYILTTCLSL